MITPEELDYIRTAAIGDMLGDSKALDEMGSAATIFRLCRELEHAQNEKTELQEVVVRIYNKRRARPVARKTVITIHML